MELLRNLFEGYPNLWGGGVAHSVLILSLVITFGIMLGKLKVAGISLGVTWILFVGIVFGHFDMNLDEHLLHFLKEFGLILFVYSIGLQVGPGFFSAFKKGGLTLNMVAMLSVFLSVVITIVLHFATGIPITTMVGILSGAVTNTPGLGAAQQANSDLNGVDAPEIALGYAVAYPLGVVGCILALLALKFFMRINTQKEEEDAEHGLGHLQELTVRPISVEIRNEAIDGKRIRDVKPLLNRAFVISRIRHTGSQETELANADTVQHMVNILCAVLLGPFYGVGVAFCASLIRNLLGIGSLMAFPGSMFGALLCGLMFWKTKNIPLTLLAEVFGTAILGGLCAYPVAILFMGMQAGQIAFYAYVIPFLISTAGGAILSGILLGALRKTGILKTAAVR